MTDWRQARLEDAAAIAALSCALLPDYPEDAAVFAERIALCPEGCHVLEGDEGISGYVISHPWRRYLIPPLNAPLGALPDAADCWYIHDMGLGPAVRGAGAGRRIIDHLAEVARRHGLPILALVAVSGAAAYWARRGFTAVLTPEMREALGGYGDQSVYMERAV